MVSDIYAVLHCVAGEGHSSSRWWGWLHGSGDHLLHCAVGEKPPPWWEIPLLGGVLLHCTDGKNSKPPDGGEVISSPAWMGENSVPGLVDIIALMALWLQLVWWPLQSGGCWCGVETYMGLQCCFVFMFSVFCLVFQRISVKNDVVLYCAV